jgi:hypothetical protein
VGTGIAEKLRIDARAMLRLGQLAVNNPRLID